MTRRIGFDEAPAAAREDYRRYLNTYLGLTGTSWGAWWARYGAEYSTGDAGGEVAAGEPVPGGDTVPGSPAVQIVPGRASGSAAMKRAPEHPDVPGGDGVCLACGEPLGDEGRYCSLDCRERYELQTRAVPARPAGQRSLRNDIARALLEGYDRTWYQLRFALLSAGMAVEACTNWVLVFGPQSLIDEVAR